jgi:selenium-binding protein 1
VLIGHDTFEAIGPWEVDRRPQYFAYGVWWHLRHDMVMTSEWATPRRGLLSLIRRR